MQTAATEKELARRLHPRLRRWFQTSYLKFTHAQLLAVPAILDQQSILLTSPTGSGKTLAGFLGVFDFLLRNRDKGETPCRSDRLLKRRRLGSVEENFIKQLNVGDRFVLAGRVVKLTDTGVNEVFVERADGQLPTVPRWNSAKMPLTSGVARGVRKLRGELARRLKEEVEDSHPGYHDTYASRTANSIQQGGGPYALTARRPAFRYAADWLVENYHISSANSEAIVEQFQAQMRIPEIPSGTEMLVELYRDGERLNYFFHSLIGRSANDALSRIVAWRVKKRVGGNALVTIDDYRFLLTLRPFQEMPLEDWRLCFEREGAEKDLQCALRRSELVRWQFRGVAQTGLIVPRQLPGRRDNGNSWVGAVKFCFVCWSSMNPIIHFWWKPIGRRHTHFSMRTRHIGFSTRLRMPIGNFANCVRSRRFHSRSTPA